MGQVQRINDYSGDRVARVRSGQRKRKRKSSGSRTLINKMAFVKWLFTIAVIFLAYKIFELKNIYGTEYENRAITQQINSVVERTINPNRGNILDRNSQSLAVSTTVYDVILDVRIMLSDDITKSKLDANELTKRQKSVKALNEILGIPMDTLDDYLAVDSTTGNPKYDTNWKVIANGVDRKTVDTLKALNLSAVHFIEDTSRTYIHNNLAAQLIGFKMGDTNIWGLERYYNSYMQGISGRYFSAYSNSASPVAELVPAVRGSSLVTTIDLAIQQFSEELAAKWGNDLIAQNVSIIVMNPNTGEIYAMVDFPSYNLNDPKNLSLTTDTNNKSTWEALSDQEQLDVLNGLWRNYNVSDTFEPGSIFKPIVIAAALEEGKVSLDQKFNCTGGKFFASGKPIPCHYTAGHGIQTLEEAIANSCNVALMEIVEQLGKEDFYKYQKDFGFAGYTGIDLPGESNSAPNVYTLADLSIDIQLGSSAIGQGFNCTPIQAITAFAAVVNGGNLLKPYVVSQIIDENGNVVLENTRTVQQKVISKETSDYLRVEMEKVFTQGTGKNARVPGYAIGGKTGTGQQELRDSKKYVLSFISYFPVDNPEYIVQISVNRPYVEDDNKIPSISPMMKELLEKIIAFKSIPPSYSQADVKATAASNTLMPDITGKSLAEATKLLIDRNINYDLVGARGNIVGSQRPEAGTVVNSQTVAILIMAADGSGNMETVPNLKGMPYEDAELLLTGLGFNAAEVFTETENGDGLVYGQIPEAGTQLVKGAYIKLKANINTGLH